MAERSVDLEIAGEAVQLLGERAVYWPRRATLLVADLHWGKAETFRALGVSLPPVVGAGVLDADLARLDRAVERTGARRLLVLGDLIHAREGVTSEVVARVTAWRRGPTVRGVEFGLVPGNHDRHLPRLPEEWSVEVLESVADEGPFRFVHDPATVEEVGAARAVPGGTGSGSATEGRRCVEPYAWAGHVHPVARLRGGGDALRLPCFHLGPRVGVLPAFSELTGGQPIRRSAAGRRFVVVEGHVVEV